MKSLRMLAVVAALGAASGQRTPQGRLPVEIRIELGQERFVTKESMVARVLIRNTNAAPVDVPNAEDNRNAQPVYTVTGPSYPNGYSFHFRKVAIGDTKPAARLEKGMMITLAPGQTHEAALPFEQLVKFPQPGTHTLTASVEVAGLKASSAPVGFVIERAIISALEPAIDDGAQSSNPIRVLCLVGESPRLRLYQAIFREERPDLGEVSLAKLIHVAPADPKATTVFGPWTNHDRMGSFLNRFGWQAGAVLGVEGLAGSPSVKFTLPQTPRLVRPALMPDSGEVDTLALSADGRTLWLVRFPVARPGAEPKLIWSTQLAAAPAGARAALAPRTAGARRFAVLIQPDAGGAAKVLLVESGANDAAPVTRTVVVPGATPLPESEPAISVDPDGTVHSAVLFAEDARFRGIFVADVTWPPGQGEGIVKRTAAGRLPSPPRGATVAYSVDRKPGARREWLVMLREGTVIFSRSPGRPRQVDGTPALPLNLVAMSHMTYLLTLNKQGLPQLELMH